MTRPTDTHDRAADDARTCPCIHLDSSDSEHVRAVRDAVGDVEIVTDDDFTYVDHDDEIAGAQLLADVHTALEAARGEADND